MAIAGIDQALLSALNLGIAVLFLHFATKEAYGLYTLVAGLVLLAGGVQNQLVTTPLMALGARMDGDQRNRFVSSVFWLQLALSAAVALLLALGVRLQLGAAGNHLAMAGAAAVLGTWMREFQRTVCFLEQQPQRALFGDGTYCALAFGGLLLFLRATHALTAGAALAAIGVAALMPGPILIRFLRAGGAALDLRSWWPTAVVLFQQGRWTLPGMGVTWGQNTGYAYVVALLLGPAAVADLAAARLFVMPLNLMVAAWNRAFLPRAGACIARGDGSGLNHLCRRSALLLGAVSVLWLAARAAFFVAGTGRVLPRHYAEVVHG